MYEKPTLPLRQKFPETRETIILFSGFDPQNDFSPKQVEVFKMYPEETLASSCNKRKYYYVRKAPDL